MVRRVTLAAMSSGLSANWVHRWLWKEATNHNEVYDGEGAVPANIAGIGLSSSGRCELLWASARPSIGGPETSSEVPGQLRFLPECPTNPLPGALRRPKRLQVAAVPLQCSSGAGYCSVRGGRYT